MAESEHITTLSDLKSLLASHTYVVADFYADWCPPCKMIAPLFAQLSSQYTASGKIAFAKINVDHAQQIAHTYSVTAMPTFLFFRDGQVFNTIQGANPPGLKSAVEAIGAEVARTLKKEQDKEKAKKVAAEAEGRKEDTAPVSGGYSMNSAARADWKMSLRG